MAPRSLTSATVDRQRPSLLLDQSHRFGQVVGGAERIAHGAQVVAQVADGDVGSQPGELQRVAPALTSGRSGDHRHPAGERCSVVGR